MSSSIKFVLVSLFFSAVMHPLMARERIAVMPFVAGKKITGSEAEYITERVRVALIKTEKFDVVSNDQLATMLKTVEERQKIGTCNSEECFVAVGRALECSYMMVGKIENAFGEYTVSGKILNVADQRYVKADEVTIKEKIAIPESSRVLVDNLTDTLRADSMPARVTYPQPDTKKERSFRRHDYGTMVGLTLLAPGAGHLYAEQWRGAFYATLWVGSAFGLFFGHIFYTSNQTAYENAVAGFDTFYDKAQSWKKVRGYSSYIFLGTYVVALLDILITGGSYEKIYTSFRKAPEANTVQFVIIQPQVDYAVGANTRQTMDGTGLGVIRYF